MEGKGDQGKLHLNNRRQRQKWIRDKSNEQRATSKRAKSKEQRAKSKEQRAKKKRAKRKCLVHISERTGLRGKTYDVCCLKKEKKVKIKIHKANSQLYIDVA